MGGGTTPLLYMIEYYTIKRSTYIFASLIATITALFLWILVMPGVKADMKRGTNEHLVTIHDRGKERSVISKKDTLGEVLNEAEVLLDKNDIVEPGLDQTLVAESYQVNIYRARPVVIVDGANKVLVMSAYQTPKLIAGHAGIELHDEDDVTMDISNNLIRDGASEVLSIKRATGLELVLYGKRQTVYTQTKTVAELLKEKKIAVAANDTVSVPNSTPIVAGMMVEIWRNGKQTVTQDEPIQFEVEQVRDANQPVGYKKVQTAGKLGKKTVTYEIEMKNGKEVSRKEIQSVEVEKSSKQVEVIGANVANLGGTCSAWMAAAGITDIANANYVIERESHCNPYAVNKSSGACGIGQALPCSKMGCSMGDGQCQMIWMNSYVMGRYGSWAAAAAHSRTYGWY